MIIKLLFLAADGLRMAACSQGMYPDQCLTVALKKRYQLASILTIIVPLGI